ncbi:MAG: efflux RND transporter permease subunit [Planctomycetes bacterium]|nr:efflux RND transporter permease subunit [Planctomycetota bacterium]
MIRALVNLALDNRIAVLFLIAALAGVGLWAMFQLPIDAVPDVTNVQVQILTKAPALGAEEIERFVTFPIEAAMNGVPRVEEIRSVSQFGLSAITVVFHEGTDIYWARQMVTEKLNEAREQIPPDMGSPEIGPVSTGLGEIYQFEVRSQPGHTHSPMQLREILDWQIAKQLRGVPGVIEVNTFGGEVKTYEVQLDPRKLQNHGVSISAVMEALRENNANAGGGYLVHHDEQRIVRGEGLIAGISDIENVVLRATEDGTPIFVRDVAAVQFAPMLRQGAVTRDARGECVIGVVMLLAGENARIVADRVKDRIEEIQKTLPEGVVIDPFYDRTDLVRRTIHTAGSNLLQGGVLVLAVLLLLLGNWRAAVIVAVTLPLAMLGAFAGMLWAGLSGNLMSLGAVDFGLIVDGPVVMVENMVRRLSEFAKRHGRRAEASLALLRSACQQVARPVVFGGAIIMLVYLPILSLRGIEGKMFRPMAWTVLFALGTALVLALVLMPVLAAIFLRRGASDKETLLIRWAKAAYRPLLRTAMARPVPVVLTTVAVFAASLWIAKDLGAVFVPKLDEEALAIQAVRLPSVSLESSVTMTGDIERTLRQFQPVESVISKTGRPEIATDPMTVNLTDIIINLKPRGEWRGFESKDELVAAMQQALDTHTSGNAYSFSQPIELRVQELIAGVRADVGISLYGDDLRTLTEKAEEIAAVLERIPGAADVGAEQVAGLPYLNARIKRDSLARHGINARQVLDVVAAVGGVEVAEVFEGQRRFPLRVRLAPDWRGDLQQIRQIQIADPRGRHIPLEQLADLTEEDGPAQISRDCVRRRTLIQCNVRGRDLAGFVAEAREKVDAQVALPAGYSLTWGGQFKNLRDATARLAVAVPVALLLILAFLFVTFQSARLTALIFLNVPIAATGGILALWFAGLPFSISAGVGFIALFGIAVLNGVVLVNYIVDLRRQGVPSCEAVFDGAVTRLRPVLMTALTTGLGLLPRAISTGTGAEVQQPVAIVVIGGLISSTILTLLVLPAVYRYFEPRHLATSEPEDAGDRDVTDEAESARHAGAVPTPHAAQWIQGNLTSTGSTPPMQK